MRTEAGDDARCRCERVRTVIAPVKIAVYRQRNERQEADLGPLISDAKNGLDGVVAARSAISSIQDGMLTYRGYDVVELAGRSTFEESVFLLWRGQLPTTNELVEFTGRLRSARTLPPQIDDLIRAMPPNAGSMSILRTAVSALAAYDSDDGQNREEVCAKTGMSIMARMPTIVASIGRKRAGLTFVPPDPTASEAGNFLAMMLGRPADTDHTRMFDAALILHADHEFNASTFSARVAASTLADVYAAVVAALSTLQGPLHGGAAESVMAMLETIGKEARVVPYLDEALEQHRRIAGFGHRVYDEGDPRARVLKVLCGELARATGNMRWYNISTALEQYMYRRTSLLPNVDFYSASLYTYLGLPSYIFPALFAISRTAGWIAHILEQYENNRLIRPRAEYNGVGQRSYVPVKER